MADDFVNLRRLTGFVHEMPLDEAYRWQDAMVEILPMGEVVGYKTGGHDPNPPNPNFPPGGIRAHLLAGMFRDDGDAMRVDETAAGFLEADFAFRVGDAVHQHRRDRPRDPGGAGRGGAVRRDPRSLVRPRDGHGQSDDRVQHDLPLGLRGKRRFPSNPPRNGSLVLRSFDYAVLDENDAVIQEGSMAEWYDPIAAVRWLRDQLRASGKELVPGHLLSLGNVGIMRQIHEGSPRGPAYASNQFRLEYYGLTEDGGPATVTINIAR